MRVTSPSTTLWNTHGSALFCYMPIFSRSTLLSRKLHCLPDCRSPYTARCRKTTSPLISPQPAGSLIYTASSKCAWINACFTSRCRSNQPFSFATATAIFTLAADGVGANVSEIYVMNLAKSLCCHPRFRLITFPHSSFSKF